MPTVHRIDGLRVVVYPNDHRPAHVHVIGPGSEAVLVLNCPDRSPELWENFGFDRSRIGHIRNALADVLPALCAEWRQIHGDY